MHVVMKYMFMSMQNCGQICDYVREEFYRMACAETMAASNVISNVLSARLKRTASEGSKENAHARSADIEPGPKRQRSAPTTTIGILPVSVEAPVFIHNVINV